VGRAEQRFTVDEKVRGARGNRDDLIGKNGENPWAHGIAHLFWEQR
jgi:hypothetical protein